MIAPLLDRTDLDAYASYFISVLIAVGATTIENGCIEFAEPGNVALFDRYHFFEHHTSWLYCLFAPVFPHSTPTPAPPRRTVLAPSAGSGVFRPQARYDFFISGPYVSEREFADLVAALESARIRPQIVVRDERDGSMPPAI